MARLKPLRPRARAAGRAASPPGRRPVRIDHRARRDTVIGVAVIGSVISVVLAVVVYGAISTHDQQIRGRTPAAAASPPTTGASSAPVTTVPLTPQQKQAEDWSTQVTRDFAPLAEALQPLLLDVKPWEEHATPTAAATVAADVTRFLPDFQSARQALARQAALSLAPQALADYRSAADLYTESIRLTGAAAGQPQGPLELQIQLSSDRVRELADRVFDQASVVLQPFTPVAPPAPGVTIIKPLDVPVWAEVGLAAGPPLDVATPAAPRTYYQSTRPQESLAAWRSQVSALALPSAGEEADAIRTGTAADLRSVSDRFSAAEAALTADPDPSNGRVTGTRLRLGLLVDAEAARTAEEAVLLGSSAAAPPLRQVSAALAVIGDGMWDSQLGPRSTGLAASY